MTGSGGGKDEVGGEVANFPSDDGVAALSAETGEGDADAGLGALAAGGALRFPLPPSFGGAPAWSRDSAQ